MARRGAIPKDVRAFVTQHLHAISQLDLLLLLHAQAGRPFTAADVSGAMRVPERFVMGQLLDLTAAGVLRADDEAEPPAWRFDPDGPRARVVDDLAECVRQRRRAVHDLILAGPSDDVQVFSDAFKLRRDD